jgi:hypothetical protein
MISSVVWTTLSYVPLALSLYVVYGITLGIYRVYFSPLSHIPGPKLAAATRWYEFYYDAIKVAKFYGQIEKLHAQYGKVLVAKLFYQTDILSRPYRSHHPV